MNVPPDQFLSIAISLINKNQLNATLDERTYRAHFKINPFATARLWKRLHQANTGKVHVHQGVVYSFESFQPCHLLWLLHYLKTYVSEDVAASFCGVSCKTHRKYVWAMIDFSNNLSRELVSKQYNLHTLH